MKYLFFDIECSNCFDGIGKMCEFGYVLTDDKFNVISRHDIPMNPGKGDTKFDKKIRKRDPNFAWAYDEEVYRSCPEFPEYYERIRKMFEADDVMVFGYAVDNDIRYLGDTLLRYNKPLFEYIAYDIQIMMNYYSKKIEKFTSLDHAFKSMCGISEYIKLRPHLSRDDAYMTMMVLKGMCENLEVSLEELISLCPKCKYAAKEYLEDYFERRKVKKEHPEQFRKKGTRRCAEGQVLWGELYREHLPLLEDPNSIGKFVTVSGELKSHIEELKEVIKYIKDNGYVAFDRINGSDYLIVYDEKNGEDMTKNFKHPYGGKIIAYKDFLKIS